MRLGACARIWDSFRRRCHHCVCSKHRADATDPASVSKCEHHRSSWAWGHPCRSNSAMVGKANAEIESECARRFCIASDHLWRIYSVDSRLSQSTDLFPTEGPDSSRHGKDRRGFRRLGSLGGGYSNAEARANCLVNLDQDSQFPGMARGISCGRPDA